MGYRVSEYSRDELRRVSLPGNAVSTLFWVVPLGRWDTGHLDQWWRLFTTGDGTCRQLGLLLVQDHTTERQATASWARLDEVVPSAEVRSTDTKEHPRLLVLSGAYPQPGWAVELDTDRDPHSFEILVRCVMTILEGQEYRTDLAAIRTAQAAFHERRSLDRPERPARPHSAPRSNWTAEDMNVLEAAIGTGAPRNVAGALADVLSNRRGLHRTPEWDTLSRSFRHYKRLVRHLDSGGSKLLELLSIEASDHFDFAPRTARPPSRDEQEFVRWFEEIRVERPALSIDALAAWAHGGLRVHLLEEAAHLLESEKRVFAELLHQCQREEADAQRRHEAEQRQWREQLDVAERRFRAALGDASTAQWRLGPRFLVELEKAAADSALPARSVPWDPPRMVGWKLHLALPRLTQNDLVAATCDVLSSDHLGHGNALMPSKLDGSVFADYAYYIVTSVPNKSARDATCDLITTTLTPFDLVTLCGGGHGQDRTKLASRLLESWGWPKDAAAREKSLSSCVQFGEAGRSQLCHEPSEVRKALESCLKDVVRVLLSKLGWSSEMAESHLPELCNEFRRTRPSWADEIDRLTTGGAAYLLRPLLPLACPTAGEANERVITVLFSLAEDLNLDAHHNSRHHGSIEADRHRTATNIEEFLSLAHQLVGELPWHLKATQIFGDSPAIATGHAWCHSYREERVIRVLLSEGVPSSDHLLVWNPSRRNPVMTDAVLLGGPRASRRC